MSELVTNSVAQEQQEQRIGTRTAVERLLGFTMVAAAVAVLAVLVATAIYAQDKYSLKSPSGIAFSDFRGYEDWAVVSSARTDEVLIRQSRRRTTSSTRTRSVELALPPDK
jgi:hypothetical protein